MFEAIEAWAGANWLRESPTAYLFVNAGHILGIGLLIGAILPLDLRLLGFFRRFTLLVLLPFLTRCAAAGLALAIFTGVWLFSVEPAGYLANQAFQLKLALLAVAISNAGFRHWRADANSGRVSPGTRISAGFSLLLWLSALISGRWIGFL